MSTRCTIAHSNQFHLYQECFEQDNVYLRLDSGDWSASLETATIDWRDGESVRPSLHLRVDVIIWRQIVEGWMRSHWAQHPEDDHKKVEINFESFNSWLEGLAAKKSSISEEEKREVDDDQ